MRLRGHVSGRGGGPPACESPVVRCEKKLPGFRPGNGSAIRWKIPSTFRVYKKAQKRLFCNANLIIQLLELFVTVFFNELFLGDVLTRLFIQI